MVQQKDWQVHPWSRPQQNVKKRRSVIWLSREGCSRAAGPLFWVVSAKWGEEQQGNTVDRNTWLAPPPGQEDFYCKYTLSISKHPTHTLSSCKQQSEPRATVSSYNFLMPKMARFVAAKERPPHGTCSQTTERRLIHGKKKSNVRQYMAECLPLSGSKLIAVCRRIDRRS